MAERSFKATKAHHVFKKHFSDLGKSMSTNLSMVVSELYSTNLLSLGSKDKALSDTPMPPYDKALAVLNEVEGRIKSDAKAFEDFLNVLCCDQIDLERIAEPMRLEYQRLCEESNRNQSALVVDTESSCFVAPGLSAPVGIGRGEESESFSGRSLELRPQRLPFTELVEHREIESPAIQGSSQSKTTDPKDSDKSLVPFIAAAPARAESDRTAQCKVEIQKWVARFVESAQDDSHKQLEEEFQEKVEYMKQDYQLRHDQLKAELNESKRMHKDEIDSLQGTVDSLKDTVDSYAIERQAHKVKIRKMEAELDSIHKEFTAKTKEVEELRKVLADRETELDKVKTLMQAKEEELRQIKGDGKKKDRSPLTKELQLYEGQIALCNSIQDILVQLRNCPPEKVDPLKSELKYKVEKLTTTKKGRWNTL